MTDPLMLPGQPARSAEHRPPTAHDPRLRGGITVRCVCGHNQARHEIPGFDGECIADGCRCTGFVAHELPIAATTPDRTKPAALPKIETVEALVAAARTTQDRRALLVIGRIQSLTAELHALVIAHHARQRDAAFAEQIKTLPKLVGKRVAQTYGDYPCPEDGCDYTATTPQGRATHYRCAHEDLDLPCGDCGRRFTTRAGLTNHRRFSHPGTL